VLSPASADFSVSLQDFQLFLIGLSAASTTKTEMNGAQAAPLPPAPPPPPRAESSVTPTSTMLLEPRTSCQRMRTNPVASTCSQPVSQSASSAGLFEETAAASCDRADATNAVVIVALETKHRWCCARGTNVCGEPCSVQPRVSCRKGKPSGELARAPTGVRTLACGVPPPPPW
jgi:hypothetical protein